MLENLSIRVNLTIEMSEISIENDDLAMNQFSIHPDDNYRDTRTDNEITLSDSADNQTSSQKHWKKNSNYRIPLAKQLLVPSLFHFE